MVLSMEGVYYETYGKSIFFHRGEGRVKGNEKGEGLKGGYSTIKIF